jgi:hypothetical protein
MFSRRLLVPLLTLMLAAAVFAPAAAHAQAHEAARTSAPARPMPARSRRILFAAGFGGGALALGLSVGLGALMLVGHDSDLDDCPNDECGFGRGAVAFAVGSASALVGVPLSSALFTRFAGRKMGYQGRLGLTFLSALGGVAVGGGLGFGTFMLVGEGEGDLWVPAFVASSAVGVLSVAGFSMLGYWGSDRRQAGLVPRVARTATGGLTFGIAARF